MEGTGQQSGYDNGGFVDSHQELPRSMNNQEIIASAASLEEGQASQQQRAKQKSKNKSKVKQKTLSPRPSGCQICILVCSSITILFSVGMLAGGFWMMFDAIMQSQMEVREGSTSYTIWKTTPFPLILNLYIWNITNHEEFLNGAKPILQECGPYVWKEYHDKQGIEFHRNNTVTYLQQRWWIADEELSGNNSFDDRVYVMNPIPLSSVWSVRHMPRTAMPFLNSAFNDLNEPAVVFVTVNELIFTGFHDPLLDYVQEELVSENGTLHDLLPFLGLPPGLSDYDRFGWFYMRNMSLYYDGVFNMMTGTDDIRNVGQIDLWNYTKETPFFDSPCNAVTGSAGEYFPPDLKRDKIVFYSSDLCMSMTMHYQKDVEMDGLKAYRFWGSNNTFANGSQIPGNECYCVKGTCAPMGLLNAESCRMGSPAFISFPHYFNADPFLLEQIEGLSPEEEKHAFIMDLIPETGIPINVKARMQINMRVTPYPGGKKGKIDILEKVPDIYLPMIWFEEFAEVPEDMIGQLKALQFIQTTPTITICFSVTLLLGLGMMAYLIYARRK
ncbi:protein croquemort-like [Palaemon carinicauda]|uniref:protein croquemort-like n=1 Tax=Palaemon carinicauda TaxID=392227 RepID=UPI0035B5B18C